MCQRIAKHQYNEAGTTWEKSTYYVRDAQGNVLGTYEKTGIASLKVLERDLYGSARIGMNITQAEMVFATAPSTSDFKHEIAVKQFEISNHLGNVLAVITDRKTPIDDGDHDGDNNGYNENHASGGAADNIVDFYKAQVISSSDYSPFGVQLDGRNFSSTAYRYGFNGMEKDDEMKGAGNSYTTFHRQYDSRLGRWICMDPVFKALQSPYMGYSGNPIIMVDPGGDDDYFSFDGKYLGSDGNTKNPQIRVVNKNSIVYSDKKNKKIDETQMKITSKSLLSSRMLSEKISMSSKAVIAKAIANHYAARAGVTGTVELGIHDKDTKAFTTYDEVVYVNFNVAPEYYSLWDDIDNVVNVLFHEGNHQNEVETPFSHVEIVEAQMQHTSWSGTTIRQKESAIGYACSLLAEAYYLASLEKDPVKRAERQAEVDAKVESFNKDYARKNGYEISILPLVEYNENSMPVRVGDVWGSVENLEENTSTPVGRAEGQVTPWE